MMLRITDIKESGSSDKTNGGSGKMTVEEAVAILNEWAAGSAEDPGYKRNTAACMAIGALRGQEKYGHDGI